MKKILSIIICLVLVCSFSVTAFAANATASLGGVPSEIKKDATATITVNVNGTPTLSSALVQVTLGDGLELVSGEWKKDGIMKDFTVSNGYGVIAFSGAGTMDGTVFSFVVKGKTVSQTAQNIKVDLTFKSGSSVVGTTSASKTVKVACVSHTYGNYANANATNHTRTCSACGNVETKAHTWDSGSVNKTANCKEAGNTHYTCTATGCGATKDVPISKTNNHTYGSWSQTAVPKCTTVGKEQRTCSTCQKVETRDIKATGHSLGSWTQTKAPTCTTKGTEQRKCTVSGCSYTETRDIAATGHNMGSWKTTKEATCEAKGEQTRSCSKCSHKETKAIDARGHKFSNPTVTKQPTCTETGIESGKCTRCNKETTNTIKATGHSFSTWVDTKAATCTEKGVQEHKCSKCDTVESRETDALGHDFDKPVVIKEPTLTEKGIEEGVCKTCGEKTQAELPCAFKDETTGIEIKTDEGVFQEGTEIKIEVIEKEHTEFEKVKTALKEVGSNFVAYDVSAIRDNVVVQPNGTVTVSFKIPEGFGKNVAVFYISDDGISEKLESAISEDGKRISATLSHFSSYAVVELDAADTETNVDNATDENSSNTLWIIIAIVAVIVIAGAVITIIFIKKKKAKITGD